MLSKKKKSISKKINYEALGALEDLGLDVAESREAPDGVDTFTPRSKPYDGSAPADDD